MDELIVYAVLYSIGYERNDEYKEMLDRLFLQDPQNELLLDLEVRPFRDAMLHLYALYDEMHLDHDKFSRILMNKLKEIYSAENDLTDFGKRMYKLWQSLPDEISEEEPFCIFTYADEPLSWGDEKQCRELYEKALCYYDRNS